MSFYSIRAIYLFEMARTKRTLMQSVIAPVLSTSLYFVVFGSAIGSRMVEIDGVSYGAFIVPVLQVVWTIFSVLGGGELTLYPFLLLCLWCLYLLCDVQNVTLNSFIHSVLCLG